HVAAAAALVISLGVNDPDRVEKILESSARDLKDPIRYGAGALDVAAASKKATSDHDLGGLAIASVLGLLAVRSAKKKDGLVGATMRRVTPGFVAAMVFGAAGLFFVRYVGVAFPGEAFIASAPAEWPAQLLGANAEGFP